MTLSVLSWVLSWLGIATFLFAAFAASALVIWLGVDRAPPRISWSTLAMIWIAYAGFAATGVIFQLGEDACSQRVQKTALDVATWQRSVQEANDAKWKSVIQANDRDAAALRKDKDLGDEAALHDPDALGCGVAVGGVRRINRITSP